MKLFNQISRRSEGHARKLCLFARPGLEGEIGGWPHWLPEFLWAWLANRSRPSVACVYRVLPPVYRGLHIASAAVIASVSNTTNLIPSEEGMFNSS
jgi:hypothetical protein